MMDHLKLAFMDETIVDASADKGIPVSVWYPKAAEAINSTTRAMREMDISWSFVQDRDALSHGRGSFTTPSPLLY